MINKKGKIYFGIEALKDIMTDEKIANELFSKFYPLNIQDYIDYNLDGKLYIGVSPYFDEIPEGELVPEYEVRFIVKQETPGGERQTTVTFKKKKYE
jgi:hypothetical protein